MNTQEILKKADNNERLNEKEALHLYCHAELGELGAAANRRRKQRTDTNVVTYLVDRNINYTNVCDTACKFCAFYRPYGHSEAYVLNRETLAEKISETAAIGGTRVLMQGGHHPDLRLDWYTETLSWMRSTFPTIQPDCFSPSEIHNICLVENQEEEEILQQLQKAGLKGLPGGGAELLVPEIRSKVSPKKISATRWIEIMNAAQKTGLATSASMVFGFGEEVKSRIEHFRVLREQQDKGLQTYDNGFTAFIAWPLQYEFTAMGKQSRNRGLLGAGANVYLRNLAVARLYMDNFDHFQASWPTMGFKTAQIALEFGADDFGSTMLEENVVSQASSSTEQKVQVEKIRDLIREAGFQAVQRNTHYEHLSS